MRRWGPSFLLASDVNRIILQPLFAWINNFGFTNTCSFVVSFPHSHMPALLISVFILTHALEMVRLTENFKRARAHGVFEIVCTRFCYRVWRHTITILFTSCVSERVSWFPRILIRIIMMISAKMIQRNQSAFSKIYTCSKFCSAVLFPRVFFCVPLYLFRFLVRVIIIFVYCVEKERYCENSHSRNPEFLSYEICSKDRWIGWNRWNIINDY